MTGAPHDLKASVDAALGADILASTIAYGELTITVPRDSIVRVLTALRDDPALRFEVLIDICGADYPERPERFEIVYHLLSMSRNHRIRVKLSTDAETPVPSAIPAYRATDWFEREAFDMYGVLFSDHPDLRRILTDYGFSGFPLRKDFPLTGYVQVRYDEEQKRVIYEPVNLKQEFRDFDFESPWEGMLNILPGDEKAGDGKATAAKEGEA